MNSITIYSADKLNHTTESGFTYTDSYGESWQCDTADEFRDWWEENDGGTLGDDVECFLNECSE